MSSERQIFGVLDVPIDALSWDDALHRIISWSSGKESRYVCICNVHSVITATRDNDFNKVVENADMATADGAPVAWMMRRMGGADQQRINGPDLMWRYCALAEKLNQSIYLYGGTHDTLALLKEHLLKAYPRLQIAGVMSPPFRKLTDKEESEIIDQINQTSPGVVFVSLLNGIAIGANRFIRQICGAKNSSNLSTHDFFLIFLCTHSAILSPLFYPFW